MKAVVEYRHSTDLVDTKGNPRSGYYSAWDIFVSGYLAGLPEEGKKWLFVKRVLQKWCYFR